MQRRHFTALAVMTATGGCLRSQDEPIDNSSDDNGSVGSSGQGEEIDDESLNETEEKNNNETEENPSDSVEINSVDTPNAIEQGEYLDVTTTVTTENSTTVRVEIIDQSGESVAEESANINGTGEQTVTLSPIPGFQSATGNGSVRVTASSNNKNVDTSSEIEIVAPPADWEESTKDARQSISEFLNHFAAIGSDGDGQTILDTSITDQYSDNIRTYYINDANEYLTQARDEAPNESGVTDRISTLEDEVRLLKELHDLQTQASAIWPLLQDQLERFRNGNDPSGKVEPQYSTASNTHDTISESLSEFDPIVGSNYDAKITQIGTQLDIIDRMINAITAVFSARNNLNQEFYGTAFDRAQSARRDFDLAVRDIEDETNYPPQDSVDEMFRDHAEEWKNEANEIEDNAAGRESEQDDS